LNQQINSAELIHTIREAFRAVKLEDGVSLYMTEYNDSGGSAERFKELAVDDERDDWQRIDDKTLEEFTVTFCFTDWRGFRFYLPPYMIWTIRHPESTSIIGESTIFHLDPGSISYLYEKTVDEILNKEQIAVVVQFVQYCVEVLGYRDANVVANLDKLRTYN
jgi:hypothetical protein